MWTAPNTLLNLIGYITKYRNTVFKYEKYKKRFENICNCGHSHFVNSSSISWLVLRLKAWVDYFNFRSKERLQFTNNIKLTHKIKNPNIPQAQISRIKIVKHKSSSLRRELIRGFPQQPWPGSNQRSGHSEWEKDISSALICMNNFFAGLVNTSHSWIIQILKSIHIWCWFSLTTQSSSLIIQCVLYHSHN